MYTPPLVYTTISVHIAHPPHYRYAVAVALCEEGALGPLLQYLQGENALAKEYASTTLACIARQEESLVKHIAATPESVRVLAQLLRSGSSTCQQNGAFVLGRIASLGEPHDADVACTAVISPAVQLLYFGATPDIKLFAAQLLATLCEYVWRHWLRNSHRAQEQHGDAAAGDGRGCRAAAAGHAGGG